MNIKKLSTIAAVVAGLICGGCALSGKLVGVGGSVNVLDDGYVVGASLQFGSNSIGAGYALAQGTNKGVSGTISVPVSYSTNK